VIRLAVRCRPDLAERVLAELVELAPGGVEEERGETYVEYAIYGPPGELPAVPALEAAAGDGLVEISSTEIPDDWADRWRDFHEPVRVGRLCVRPTWAEADPGAEIEVAIDPGQAFGTGAHATTKLCLGLLLKLADAGEATGPLTDVGTGSGVLAIAAAKLGYSPVTGYDHELPAVEAAGKNAAANGVEVRAVRANLRDEVPSLASTVVANLTSPLLLRIAPRLGDQPRTIVVSGLLAREADEVSRAFGEAGLEETERLSEGDWAALLLRRMEPRT
jgi:ribosomal protein L11 methyltransferase